MLHQGAEIYDITKQAVLKKSLDFLIFSPDSANAIYVKREDDIPSLHFMRLEDRKDYLVLPVPDTSWDQYITALALSPDGNLLVANIFDRVEREDSLYFWQVSDGTLVKTLDVGFYVSEILFAPDGQSLIRTNLEDWNDLISVWRILD